MKYRVVLAAFIFSVFLSFIWGASLHAQSIRRGMTVNVARNEVVNGSVWASGNTIDVSGTVNGDLYCAGQTVDISGTIHGDVLCAAQTLTISGKIDGSARVAGQTVSLSGQIGRSLNALGQSVTIDGLAHIGQDASIGASTLTQNGVVGRDLLLGGATVVLNGNVGRDIKGAASNLTVNSGAKVGGNLDYTSANNASISSGAQIFGKVTHSQPKQSSVSKTVVLGLRFGFGLYILLAVLFSNLILTLLFPGWFRKMTAVTEKAPHKAFGVGLLALILAPIVIIACAATIIGIPLALLLGQTWIIILELGFAALSYYVGRVVWSSQKNAIITMLIGSIITLLLLFIPFIGFFVLLASGTLGVGSVLKCAMSMYKKPVLNS
jgi:cytoskeletal protein CcmA (bactofilin family)